MSEVGTLNNDVAFAPPSGHEGVMSLDRLAEAANKCPFAAHVLATMSLEEAGVILEKINAGHSQPDRTVEEPRQALEPTESVVTSREPVPLTVSADLEISARRAKDEIQEVIFQSSLTAQSVETAEMPVRELPTVKPISPQPTTDRKIVVEQPAQFELTPAPVKQILPEVAELPVMTLEVPLKPTTPAVVAGTPKIVEKVPVIKTPAVPAKPEAIVKIIQTPPTETSQSPLDIVGDILVVPESISTPEDHTEVHAEVNQPTSESSVTEFAEAEISEQTDEALTVLSEIVETEESDQKQKILDIIQEIAELPIAQEMPDAPSEIELNQKLELLVIELFESAEIEYTQELVNRFVKLARAHYFEQRLAPDQDQESIHLAKDLPIERGTNEFLRRLQTGAITLRRALGFAQEIGKSTLRAAA